MAIIKAGYTKSRGAAKASIRYIQHRTGKDKQKSSRQLYGIDGVMDRQQAYQMIDEAEKGSIFFRILLSPDPDQEDTHRDLHLPEITAQTMLTLEERIRKPLQWVAAEHNDHAPHRHVHILALVAGRVETQDLQALRQTATASALSQRQQQDLAREQQQQKGGGLELTR